jgi:hypothetical protein
MTVPSPSTADTVFAERESRRWLALLGFAVVGAFIVVGLISIWVILRVKDEETALIAEPDPPVVIEEGEVARERMEQYFRVPFPSAEETGNFFWAETETANQRWIRFDIIPDELQGVIAGTPAVDCQDLDLATNYMPQFSFINQSEDGDVILYWWTPEAVNFYIGADCVSSNETTYKILVDTSSETVWTVFMEITQPETL